MVRVEWLLGGLSWVGVGLWGPFGVDVVVGRIRFLVGGGRSLVVGGVVALSAWWVVRPSHVLVVFVHGGLLAGGVGRWAVVVVVMEVVFGLVVVVVVVHVVAGALVAAAVVVGLVVFVVLWVRPQDPLAFRWGVGVGHRLQPLGLRGLVDSGGGFGAGLGGDRGRGVPRPRVGLAGGGGGFWGPDDEAPGDGDVDEGLDGVVLCCRLRGCGSRLGQRGSGCGGFGVLVRVSVKVWVRAAVFLVLLQLCVL